MIFRPPRALGVIVGSFFTAWAVAVFALALRVSVGAPPGWKAFLGWVVAAVALVLAGAFAYWTVSIARLSYRVERGALVITWGWRRVVVPLDTVQRLVPGRTVEAPAVEGLNWWGCHVGHAEVPRLGYVLFFATQAEPEELLYVVTTGECYALTVPDQAAFAEAVQGRVRLSPVSPLEHRAFASGMAAMPFWRDRSAIVWAAALAVAAAAVSGYVLIRYPGLPEVVRFSYPEFGGLVRIGAKSELLRIAYLAAGIGAANIVAGALVHARDRAAGLWMFAGGVLIELVLLGAAVSAIARA